MNYFTGNIGFKRYNTPIVKIKPKGTIYEHGKSGHHGEQILLFPWFFRVLMQVVRGVGAGMIALAVLIFMFTYGPIISQEFNYKFADHSVISEQMIQDEPSGETVQELETVETIKADELLETQREAREYGVTSYFSVVIPKINAKANIVANVDTSNKKEYLDALQKGVAHARGTNFPGQDGRIFLFSHSTDSPLNFAKYNAIFYLLKKLEKGDNIIVYFSDKKYEYKVEETKIVTAADTQYIEPSIGEEELVLMTCDPPGTNWNRLLVFAKPILIEY